MSKKNIEALGHILFWFGIVITINIDWMANWFDPEIRPNTPAPMSLIVFAIYFYANTFFLIPNFFMWDTAKRYALFAVLLFLVPELIRILLYSFLVRDVSFPAELFSRDSFIFGAPSAFLIAINLSFIYRITKDRLLNRNRKMASQKYSATQSGTLPYQGRELLNSEEIVTLEKAIINQMEQDEAYLNPNLSLRDLAEAVHSTEKKVSYFINQQLKTNFFEMVNKYRISKFKQEVSDPRNRNLSIVGIALNCGFSSKSSFYRAFKSNMGMSPSEFIKSLDRNTT